MNAAMLAGALLGTVIGFVCGIVAGVLLSERSFDRGFRLQRTGKPEAPATAARAPVTVPSPEGSAVRAITADMIAHGAADIMRAAQASGVPMTQREAERQARELAEAAGLLGGAH